MSPAKDRGRRIYDACGDNRPRPLAIAIDIAIAIGIAIAIATWCGLGALGMSWGGLGAVLERLGGGLGRSRAFGCVFGRSWGRLRFVLGLSWGVLERSWDRLRVILGWSWGVLGSLAASWVPTCSCWANL